MIRAFLGRDADDRDLDRELSSHLQLIEDEYLRRELPPSARPYRGELHGMAAE